MINKLIKKIWFICLWFASFTLAGCFHVPDEDWLLSDTESKPETSETDELGQAFNEFIDNFNSLSDKRDEIKNDEDNEDESEILEETLDIQETQPS